jgi:4-hydroxyphenylacetate 3-monooxygenase
MSQPDPYELRGTLVERVSELLPKFSERAVENEEARQLIDANFIDLTSIGFFRALVPKKYGGLECDIRDWLQAVRMVASADAATGWSAGVLSVHGHGLAYFSDRVLDEIWGATGPDTIVSSSAAAEGTAEFVEGGLRLNGRWRFSSGVDRASWVLLASKPVNPETGDTEFYMSAIPRSDITIDDTWRTSGMRGTGSKDVIVKDVFVPDYRKVGPGYENFTPPYPARFDNPLYSVPFISVFPIIFAPIMLGAAEGAVAMAQEKIKTRVRPHTGQKALNSAPAIMRIAESTLELSAAAALIERHWEGLAALMATGEPMPLGQMLRWRGEHAYIGELAVRALDRVMDGAGGSATYNWNPLQRFFRDLHTARGHAYMDVDSALQVYGRETLGLEPDPLLV